MKWVFTILAVAVPISVLAILNAQENQRQGRYADITVLFLCVGGEEDAHLSPLQDGLDWARNDFSCDLKVWYCGWQDETILKDLSSAIHYRPHAIVLPGYESEQRFQPLVAEALAAGIKVTTYLVPMRGLERQYKMDGLGFVGQENYEAGRALALRAMGRFGITQNSKVLVMGNARPNADLRERPQGICDILKEKGIPYQLLNLQDYWQRVPFQNASDALRKYLDSNGKPDLFFFDAGGLEGLIKAFDENRISPGEINAVGFDGTVNAVQALRENYAQLVLAQDGRLISYLAVLQACIAVDTGMGGMHIATPDKFFDLDNLHELEMLLDKSGA